MIGDTLKTLRTEKGLTLKQMGEILGVSHMTYQRYEKNDCDVSTEMLAKLADFYGVTTDYLLGREEKPNPLSMLNGGFEEDKFIEKYRQLPQIYKEVLAAIIDKLAK